MSKYFPPRNRIVSGLSDAIVVIEARKRSGTLITVDMALGCSTNTLLHLPAIANELNIKIDLKDNAITVSIAANTSAEQKTYSMTFNDSKYGGGCPSLGYILIIQKGKSK